MQTFQSESVFSYGELEVVHIASPYVMKYEIK